MDFLKSNHMTQTLLFLLLMVSPGHAQNFAEWFKQKKTQKKYLLQQIAGLQIYIESARKGYRIAKKGLTVVGDFTKGEFNLHTDYFNSLKKVNPVIRRYAKVAEVMALQVKIMESTGQTSRQISGSDIFSDDEKAYIHRVFNRLHDDCGKTLDELIRLTSASKPELRDDERMSRIDKLYLDMQDKFTFSQEFSNEVKGLTASRLKEKKEVESSRQWQGIKN